MSDRIPAEVFPPGEFIRDELEQRDWTQSDLARILGRPIQAVNEVITGKKSVTPETAQGLGEAFGTGPELWLNLESAYRLSLVQPRDADVARRARLYEKAPIGEMIKRSWIDPSNRVADLEKQVVCFYELTSIEDTPRLNAAARKHASCQEMTPSQMAWLFRAKHLATALDVAEHDPKRLMGGLSRLRQLASGVEGICEVPASLGELGIRFVIVEHLPKTWFDGAAFWLNDQSPVIAMSLRYDRIDGFWFVLGHELGHIKNGDAKDEAGLTLDSNLVGKNRQRTDEKSPKERRADQFAAEFLVPQKDLESFIARVRPPFSKKRIIQFANRMGVHPGIVVGQLQHRLEIKYSHSREMLVKVRDLVTKASLTDGWGQLANVR